MTGPACGREGLLRVRFILCVCARAWRGFTKGKVYVVCVCARMCAHTRMVCLCVEYLDEEGGARRVKLDREVLARAVLARKLDQVDHRLVVDLDARCSHLHARTVHVPCGYRVHIV
jgi:hypothetical protein